jgi:hypothetical protein
LSSGSTPGQAAQVRQRTSVPFSVKVTSCVPLKSVDAAAAMMREPSTV